jgi:hypothetical protein
VFGIKREVLELHEESIRFGQVIEAFESELCRTTGGAQDHVSTAGQSATNGHALALEVVRQFRQKSGCTFCLKLIHLLLSGNC